MIAVSVSFLTAVTPLALPWHSWHRRHWVNPKFSMLVKHTRDIRVRTMCAHAVRYGRRVRSSARIPLIRTIMRYYNMTRVCSVISSLFSQDRNKALLRNPMHRQQSGNALIQRKWSTYNLAKCIFHKHINKEVCVSVYWKKKIAITIYAYI